MKTKAPFIRSNGAVHLNPKTPVNMHLFLVINPGYPEEDNPLRFNNPLHNTLVPVKRILIQDRFYRFYHLGHCLVEFSLIRIPVGYKFDAVHFSLSPLYG